MTLDRSAKRIAEIVRKFLANARRANAASRIRAEENSALVREMGEARDRAAAMVLTHGGMGTYFEGASERMSVCKQETDCLSGSLEEMRTHVSALLQDETAVQVALVGVNGHSRAVADIARLARLLAINASVEAARAGDAGLGFAVVAREMQALSEESSKRARLIDDGIVGLIDHLATMRTRVTGTRNPLDALDAAATTLVATLEQSRTQSGAARNVVFEARNRMAEETCALQTLLERLGDIEMQTTVAIERSAQNAELAQEALDLADASIGSRGSERSLSNMNRDIELE